MNSENLDANSQPEQAYQAAIKDAENPEYKEISRDLTEINKYNKKLIWEGEPGKSKVWVATWTREEGNRGILDDNIKKDDVEITGKKEEIWVTVVPELNSFCYNYMKKENKVADLKLRLKQKLGLRPGSKKNRIVEIAVNPEDLFRPSKDPEITDSQAELDYRPSFLFFDRLFSYFTNSRSHKEWFKDNYTASFKDKNRQPWTQLGYTYDWGNNSSEIGLSEFVIKPKSEITIKRIATTENYCAHEIDDYPKIK